MENKYFSVGEKVGLVSKNWPELNGEYIIQEYRGYVESENVVTGALSTDHLYSLVGVESIEGSWWKQSALRKIHKSGGTSFDYMMNKLSAQEKAMNLIKNTVGEVK